VAILQIKSAIRNDKIIGNFAKPIHTLAIVHNEHSWKVAGLQTEAKYKEKRKNV